MILYIICLLICFIYIIISVFFMNDKFYKQQSGILFIINFIVWSLGVICASMIFIKIQLGDY